MDGFPITLTVSTGRCGTTFLANTFQKNYGESAFVTHEALHPSLSKPAIYHRCYSEEQINAALSEEHIQKFINQCRELACNKPVVDFGWTTASLVPVFYKIFRDRLRVIIIHRHPVEVAASFAVKGQYTIAKGMDKAITPFHRNAQFKACQAGWKKMTPFEKCLYRWLEIVAYGVELKEMYPDLAVLELRSESIYNDTSLLYDIAQFCGLDELAELHVSKNINKRWMVDVERAPIKTEWRKYLLYPEVINLAESLGYSMEVNYVEELVKKYQLPNNISSKIRHYLKYWHLRSFLGKIRDKMGV